MHAKRWSDNDKYLGPFTYAPSDYARLAFVLSSGCENYPGCSLRISAFKRSLLVALPSIIKPDRKWKDLSGCEWAKGDGYWDIHGREYGFSYNDGFLQVFLGRQTMDSSTTQQWSKFLPWTQWRHVRHSLYDTDGNWFCDIPNMTVENWEERKKIEEKCPLITFAFKDYDGEELTAKTRIEDREWRFGTGWFRWLSLFAKPKIVRSLDIDFSGETGRRKGSWKGGAVGHAINMKPQETPWQAFNRYCDEHEMKFLGMSNETP